MSIVKESQLRWFFERDVERQLKYLKHPLHKYQKLKRYLHAIEMAKINKNDAVLDIGCGLGYQIPHISKKCGNYTGIDFSSKAIEISKRYSKSPKIKFICRDVHNLPFKKNFFDVVLVIDVLENLYKPKRVLDEIKRVLKPHGRIVISVPNNDNFWWRLFKSIIRKKEGTEIPHIHEWYNLKSIKELLEKKGFEITDTRSSFFLPPFFTGKYYLIPPLKIIPTLYDFFEKILSKHMKSFGYHILVCGRKK